MNIAILGGGITGLTAGYYLSKKGHKVTVFEKENHLGGLASGFKNDAWDWSLERSYHHLFSNDKDVLDFAKEIGFNDIFFQSPKTVSLYDVNPASSLNYRSGLRGTSNYRIFPLDTPQDLLRFPLLSIGQKLRAGLVIAALKLSPFLSVYEKQTSEVFLKKSMGEDVWKILWQELFRKKFGKYAGKILSAFIWARIKKRTKKLGYIKGGFQAFVDFLEGKNKQVGTTLVKNIEIKSVLKNKNRYVIDNLEFDAVISTLSSPVLAEVGKGIFPDDYLKSLQKIEYCAALTLIIETENKLFDSAYWVNVAIKEAPFMGIVQHTNLIDKKHYNDKHILYIGNYVDWESPLLKMSDYEIFNYYTPYLKRINSKFLNHKSKYFLFKDMYAQPIFDKEFLMNKPNFLTPQANFYVANLEMTYPYDRGVNYAVAVAKKVVTLIK